MDDVGIPSDDLARVADAQDRVVAVLAPLRDADLRRASLLPGWTVGHVVAHLAVDPKDVRHSGPPWRLRVLEAISPKEGPGESSR
jgi:uncharacterized protein (TIGR03083 family)